MPDKDEVGGSSPPRPTIRPLTSGNAPQPLELSQLLLISKESTRVEPFQQPHGSLTSTFAGHWAHFRDTHLGCTAVLQRITSRADVDAARRAARIAGCPGRRCQRDDTELAALCQTHPLPRREEQQGPTRIIACRGRGGERPRPPRRDRRPPAWRGSSRRGRRPSWG
jgi:hypothetical protein